MKYYFFKTSTEMRDGVEKPTLLALPNQTFEDGTPISTTLNVQAPKEKGSSPYGSRLDYPDGTIFGSDYLVTDLTKQVTFYSVYKAKNQQPNFHPIKTNDSFSYLKPEHRDEKMEAAYALFEIGLDPLVDEEDEQKETSNLKEDKTVVYTPADENGIARSEEPNWKEKYPGQIELEGQLLARWLQRIFTEKKIALPSRIMIKDVKDIFEKLYRCGENIDTLANRARFEAFLATAGITYDDFKILKDSPLKKYLNDFVLQEHDYRTTCTALERDTKNALEINDVTNIINDAYGNITGMTGNFTSVDEDNFKKAFEAGWTLNDILDPEYILLGTDINDYSKKLANGVIPVPEKIVGNGASYIDSLLADKNNRKPKDKDGFHVDDRTWKILIDSLNRHKNTMLLGPSGSGKTELIKLLCETTGTPYTIIQMGSITDPTEQLVGKMDIDSLTGGTVFDWAEFAKAIQRPGVVILDEINRIPRNGENVLFSCLDKTRELSAAGSKSTDKRTIKVNPDCTFFATANIGDEFTGTKTIDAALMTRFVIKVELDYMSMADESKMLKIRTDISKQDAENISFVATKTRTLARKGELQVGASTRETLSAAELVADGFSILEALEIIFLPLYDAGEGPNDHNSERAVVKNIISERFSNTKK